MDQPVSAIVDPNSSSTPPPVGLSAPWWRKHKRIIVISGGIVALLIGLLIINALLQGKSPAAVLAPTPTPTAAPTPTPTIDPKEQAFFASLPQTMLYYSFAQTSNARNVFQSDVTDTQRRNVDIGFPGNYNYLTSPDGRWLLRFDEKQIERAASNEPANFSLLYKFPKDTLRATSLQFSADSSKLAVVLTQNSRSDGSQSYYTNILVILPNSEKIGDPKEIFNSDKPFRYRLVGFPAANTLWYVEDREGQESNLTKLNLENNSTAAPMTRYNQSNLLAEMQFDRWMSNGYAQRDRSIIRYNLQNGAETIVYELDNSCPKSRDHSDSKVTGFTLAPEASDILISLALKPCKDQLRDPGATPIPPQKTVVINATDGALLRQQNNLPVTNIEQAWWSPDNKHVWVTVDSTTHYTIESSTLEAHSVPSLDRQTLTKEKLYFVGWLAAFKQ